MQQDFQLNPPMRVEQTGQSTSWAAAFASLIASTGHGPASEAKLVREYGAFSTHGIVCPLDLAQLAETLGFTPGLFLDADEASIFNDGFLRQRLRHDGPVLAACFVTHSGDVPWYHAQVIWGVRYLHESDIGTSAALLDTMNPATGNYGVYPISYFRRNTPLFTCWKMATSPAIPPRNGVNIRRASLSL